MLARLIFVAVNTSISTQKCNGKTRQAIQTEGWGPANVNSRVYCLGFIVHDSSFTGNSFKLYLEICTDQTLRTKDNIFLKGL